MTFVLLFFAMAVLQVLNNWLTEGYRCEVRSYIDVSAFPARLGFTKEAGGIRHFFPRGVRKGTEMFPVARPDQIHPNEAVSSTQKSMHCPDAAAGFF